MLGTIGTLIAGSLGSSLIGGLAANSAANAQADAAADANATQLQMFNTAVELTEPQREIGNNASAALAYLAGIGERPMIGASPLDITTRTIDGSPVTLQNPGNVFGGGRNENGLASMMGTQAPTPMTEYLVGDQVFQNMADAEAYAQANATGGTPYAGFQESPGYQFRQQEGENALSRMASARGMRYSGQTLRDAMRFNSGMASQEYGNYWNQMAGLAGAGQTATGQQIGAGQNYANQYGINANAAGNARASGYMGMNNAFQGGVNNMFNILGMQQAGYFS